MLAFLSAFYFSQMGRRLFGKPGRVYKIKRQDNQFFDFNLAALHAINARREAPIEVRQVKYLNNMVEQDHGLSNTRPQIVIPSHSD
jgi:hypothetical protein